MSEHGAEFFSLKGIKACVKSTPLTTSDFEKQEDDSWDFGEDYKARFANCINLFGEAHTIVSEAANNYLRQQPIKGGRFEVE